MNPIEKRIVENTGELRIEYRPRAVFVRSGLVEVCERYDHQDGCVEAAVEKALTKLEDKLHQPVDPKVGVFKVTPQSVSNAVIA